MKTIALLVLTLTVGSLYAQKFQPKKKKKDFFGSERNDVRQLSNIGLQINFGPTFTLASKNKVNSGQSFLSENGMPIGTDLKQSGKIGGNFEIGLAHFNMKSAKFSFGRIVDYFDYGVGFKYFRGTEKTMLTYFDASGRQTGESEGNGKMANGYLGFRFSVHKLTYLGKSKVFLDNGLGLNGDYLLLKGSQGYSNMNPVNEYYSKPFMMNVHYSLGMGFKLKRGSYLIPGAYVPILALQEFNKESIHWFSSRYYPITCQVKWVYLLNKSKRKTSCTNNGSPEDKKKNEEYMQNK